MSCLDPDFGSILNYCLETHSSEQSIFLSLCPHVSIQNKKQLALKINVRKSNSTLTVFSLWGYFFWCFYLLCPSAYLTSYWLTWLSLLPKPEPSDLVSSAWGAWMNLPWSHKYRVTDRNSSPDEWIWQAAASTIWLSQHSLCSSPDAQHNQFSCLSAKSYWRLIGWQWFQGFLNQCPSLVDSKTCAHK